MTLASLSFNMFQLSQHSESSLSSSMPTSVIQQGPSSLNTGAASSGHDSSGGSRPHSNGDTPMEGGSGRQSPGVSSIPPPHFPTKFSHALAGKCIICGILI